MRVRMDVPRHRARGKFIDLRHGFLEHAAFDLSLQDGARHDLLLRGGNAEAAWAAKPAAKARAVVQFATSKSLVRSQAANDNLPGRFDMRASCQPRRTCQPI